MDSGYLVLSFENGDSFSHDLHLEDAAGDALDLTGFSTSGKFRRSFHSTSNIFDFTTAINGPATNGIINISLTAAETQLVPSKRYYYDIFITNGAVKEKIIGGILVVEPSSTFGFISGDSQQFTETNTGVTLADTTVTSVDTWSSDIYKSAQYKIQATFGTNVHFSEITVIYGSAAAHILEYGVVLTNGVLVTYTADVSGGNVRLLAQATTASTLLRISRTLTKV